jgi:alkylation response protein AidB-like acyl-CoA dehydrogenase
MTRFLLIRHAHHDYIGRAIAGWSSGISLSDRGKAQAAALPTRLAAFPIAVICSSPLERAMETAAPLAATLHQPIQFRAGLKEIDFGEFGAGLTNLEYAPLCEIMGRVAFAPEVFNCSAPDTGNMEVLDRYGTPEQQEQMAEAAARRRDPLGLRHDRAGGRLVGRHQHRGPHRARRRHYVINGRKWWSSGVGDPRCKIAIVMGKTDPQAPRHAAIA